MTFYDVRVWFTKQGDLKYISHLDLNRFMQRSLKRSGLPLWHTEGFNPHPYVTFALPLSLGQESECEIFDFRLTRVMPAEEVKAALNAVMPRDMKVLRVAAPVQKAKVIARAAYRICLPGWAPLRDKTADFLCRQSIEVQKHTKKGGESTVDLAPALGDVSLTTEGENLILRLTLPAGSTLNLNPTLLTGALAAHLGREEDPVLITRTAVLTEDGADFA